VIVRCPTCATQYRLDPERLRAGRGRLRCVRCGAVFPVATAGAPAPAARPPRAAPAPGAREAGRIEVGVVASAAGALRQLVVGGLARCGARAITLDDGPTALDMARRSRPRLVVAAFDLPGLSGCELIAAVRDEPLLAATRVLLVGGPPPSGRFRPSPAAVHGADAHLPDDVAEPEVLRVLGALLGCEPGAVLELGAEDEGRVRAQARVTVQDLALYAPEESAASRRAHAWTPALAEEIARARAGCRALIGFDRDRAAAARAFDDELARALR
jgi:predicted Zn finger-like uncharacterized protein